MPTEYLPFYLTYGYNPNFNGLFGNPPSSNVPIADNYIKNIHSTIELVKHNLAKAQSNQKNMQTRRDVIIEIKPQSGIIILNPLSHGPFKIIRKINDVSF